MTDTLSISARSALMSRVGRRDTKPELTLRKELHALGLRFRLNRKDLVGTPDIVFPRFRAIVFVHGCFWHRHLGCRKSTNPKSNVAMWERKFATNVSRDSRTTATLESAGWRVFVVWECELTGSAAVETARRMAMKIRGQVD